MVNKDYDEDDEFIPHIDQEWEINTVVGSGGFSKVYKGKKLNGKINGKTVGGLFTAIKVIEKHKFEFNEINILKKLKQHSSIAKFYGLGKDEKHIYIYMEYVYGISIADKLRMAQGCKFPENEIHTIVKSLVEAIYFIHHNCIIHRDIKGENILLDKSDISLIKLIDFGLSKQYEGSSKHHSLIGTYTHMAPEVRLQTNKAGRKSDIWSLGCTIIEMAGGDLTKVDENAIPFIPHHLSLECKHFIQTCLISNPNGRADIQFLKKHKYLHDLNFKNSILNETLLIPINSILEPIDEFDGNDNNQFKLPEIKERLGSNSILNIDNEVLLPALQKSRDIRDLKGREIITLPSFIHKYIPDVQSLTLTTFNQIITPRCIPASVKELYLPVFNQIICKNCIPSSVTKLSIPAFNKFLDPDSLPDSITSIRLDLFNQPLLPNSLPKNLFKLLLPSFDQPLLPGCIPNVVDLKLPKFNNQLVERAIPITVKRLSLPMFNQCLKEFCIPHKVEFLKMKSFNQPISQYHFPDSIKELILPSFNQHLLPDFIPDSVYYLLLSSFNQIIVPECFPSSVENLVDLKAFNQLLTPDCIPELVEELTQLDLSMFNQPITIDCIPDTVVHLSLCSFNQSLSPGTLPPKISTLLLASFNQPLEEEGCIPPNVETLSLRDYNHPLLPGVLPPSIQILILGKYNQPLEQFSIPSSVTHLVLSDFDQPIYEGSLPPSLTKLYFEKFNQDLESESIPESVTDLDLGNEFQFQDYSSNLPFNIISLKCGYKFTKPLRKRDIPSSVTELVLNNYNLTVPLNTIPKSVVSLTLGLITNDIKSLKNIPPSVINLSLVLNHENNSEDSCCVACVCNSSESGNSSGSLGSVGSGSSSCNCIASSNSSNSSSSNSSNSSEVIDLLKQNLMNSIISIKVNGEEINLN
ncbi:hypothetical protein DICPUDRAFT_146611 [Dictyostelium purpureum]|uniref:Protein kinase domain-containing protein n=1 Tax=Dictyostelium purpureum TaxID=5786 RepID=F0Z6F0_DICPU|nr:uncharacterized protein DICPUDRAFT_146611 [Dictyostelium purpureum]EGC40477.1 hypothetical protein DICPUDRAFT_146611 [Dictyostelium purpureum]|eukprot:XP_003283024.1 hypothetical protein DICPUDRAFT_146611 [Dictyostelium purpureum]